MVFAHADISGENVLVDWESGEVPGILDWEMAGFWPEWWEYKKALYGGRCREPWVQIVPGVLARYDGETEADMDVVMF